MAVKELWYPPRGTGPRDAATTLHLQPMAQFAANTGCREQEICRLRWDLEQFIPTLQTGAFVLPEDWVKNKEPKLILLNRYAQMVIEGQRGKDPEFVFDYNGKPVTRMLNSLGSRARGETASTSASTHFNMRLART